MKEKIILIGGGGHCKSCIDVIEQQGCFAIGGIVDVHEKLQRKVLGYPVIGTDADLPEIIPSFQTVMITLGQIESPTRRMELFNKLQQMGARFPVIQSPLAYVSAHAHVGEGTIVMHHALVNAGASVGRNSIINSKALVEHDAVIGDHCHISTGAIVNGGVKVGDGCFLGSGSVSKEYIVMSPNSFIKAGSLLGKNS